jgi:hypothetical protein
VLRRLDALLRFLLEGVQHKDCSRKPHRVDRPVRASLVVFDDFENPSSPKPFEWLCTRMLTPHLCVPEGKPAFSPHRAGKLFQVLLARPNPEKRFWPRAITHTMPGLAFFGNFVESISDARSLQRVPTSMPKSAASVHRDFSGRRKGVGNAW